MSGMADDPERRLAAAAEAVHELEMTNVREQELRERMEAIESRLADVRKWHALEQKDVARLEGLSLTRVLVALRGSRAETLARERAEADAAAYLLADAQARLDAVRREHEAAQARMAQLARAPQIYATVLDEKERHLAGSDDPRSQKLLELADERGRLHGDDREVKEALLAAEAAYEALSRVKEELGSASSWSTYDTFFGGGAVSSAIKHSRLDDAARAAAHADQCLAVLRTELADVPGTGGTAPELAIGQLTRFVDIFFDNIFTDLAVRNRIKQAQENVERSLHLVRDVHGRLKQRAAAVADRLATLEAERRQLLTVTG